MKEFAVALPTSEGTMELHGFVPDSPPVTRLPAVLVLQEAFGVNAHMKRVCRRVASAGYAAFSPELFHRTGPGLEFGYDEFPTIKPILGELTNGRIAEDLRVAHQHISQRPDVDTTRIASWGFCMGGWASVLAACELPIAAAISFYGGGLVHARPGIGFGPLVDRLESIRCPMLLVFGGKDAGISAEDIGALSSRLKSLAKIHEVEVYPEAGHGFFCEDRSAYNRDAAESSWTRATGWLASALG
jgi:carboxymethylenebutenolidase